MMRLYEYKGEVKNQSHVVPYKIKQFTPSMLRAYPGQRFTIKTILYNIYWWLITLGSYRIWCALDGNKVIHYSYVVPKCYKFPFLDSNSVEIGPCMTDKDYRGKGIYPSVLNNIVSDTIGKKYIIINDSNASSIRGVIKAGFKAKTGEIIVSTFKRYCYKK